MPETVTSLISSVAGEADAAAATTATPTGGGAQAPTGGGGEPEPWYSSIPAEKREGLERFKTPEALVDSFRNAQQLIGKKGLAPPAADAPPEEVAAFYDKIGRPESPDAYEWQAPEDFEVDQEVLKEFKAIAHAKGFRPEQYAAAMDMYRAQVERQAAAEDQALAEANAVSERELRKEWGDEYDAKMQDAVAAARKLGMLELLGDPRYGSNAAVIKAFAEKAPLLREDSRGPGQQGVNAKARLEEIHNDPLFLNGDQFNPKRQALLKERDELYKRLYPS